MKIARVGGWIVNVETHFEYEDFDEKFYYTYTTDSPMPANDKMYERWKDELVQEILADLIPTQEVVDRIYVKDADDDKYYEVDLYKR